MIMKKPFRWHIIVITCLTVTSISAQTHNEEVAEKKEIKVRHKTVMEQYEPTMILPVDDRIRLKKERLAEIRKRRQILDTLSISDRRKKKLLRDLYNSPHSDQWEKLIADLEFQDQ